MNQVRGSSSNRQCSPAHLSPAHLDPAHLGRDLLGPGPIRWPGPRDTQIKNESVAGLKPMQIRVLKRGSKFERLDLGGHYVYRNTCISLDVERVSEQLIGRFLPWKSHLRNVDGRSDANIEHSCAGTTKGQIEKARPMGTMITDRHRIQ